MWTHAGLVRDADGLTMVLAEISRLEQDLAPVLATAAPSRELGELRNLLAAGRLLAAAALARRESRGAHYRADFPELDPRWGRRMFVVVRGEALEIALGPEAGAAGLVEAAPRAVESAPALLEQPS